VRLSIVTTLYYSAPYVREFYQRACMAAEKITQDYEIIFVNDGSPDSSFDIAVGICSEDEKVRVVDLSRNFGHHKAIMTGLEYALGDLIFLLDADLEEAPELLSPFYQKMADAKPDVVFGVQLKRRGNWFERLSGELYYLVWELLSTNPIPRNVTTVRLMTRRYVHALLQHREREINLAGLWAITGFDQVPYPIQKLVNGRSTYDVPRKIAVLINAITSFSNKPLVYIFYLGTVIILISGISAVLLIIRRLFFNVILEGWPSLIVSVWLLGGLTIFCLGIIGIYLSKIFMETKQRPYTIVRDIYEGKGETTHALRSHLAERTTVLQRKD
jgi:putative glycosyltransferase